MFTHGYSKSDGVCKIDCFTLFWGIQAPFSLWMVVSVSGFHLKMLRLCSDNLERVSVQYSKTNAFLRFNIPAFVVSEFFHQVSVEFKSWQCGEGYKQDLDLTLGNNTVTLDFLLVRLVVFMSSSRNCSPQM